MPLQAADQRGEDLFGREFFVRCVDHAPRAGERGRVVDDAFKMLVEFVVVLQLVVVKILQQEAAAFVFGHGVEGVFHLLFTLIQEKFHDQTAVAGEQALGETDIADGVHKFHLGIIRMAHQLAIDAVVENAHAAVDREGLEEAPEHWVLLVDVGGVVELSQVVVAWVQLAHEIVEDLAFARRLPAGEDDQETEVGVLHLALQRTKLTAEF